MKEAVLPISDGKSKYIKSTRELDAFRKMSIAYIFALFVLPQYFGIPNPVFDLTAVRIMIIVLITMIIADYNRNHEFFGMIVRDKLSLFLLPYIIVLLYTMALRADINAFLNPFIEFVEMYLLIYVIRDCLGIKETIKVLMVCIYIIVFLGFVEIATGTSPFFYLKTIDSFQVVRFIRDGHYRIMSSANHSLGYGLMLVTMIPFSAYDVETKEFNAFRRPILLLLLMINVFQTGSRSTLGVSFAEILVMMFLSDKKYLKANIFYLTVSLVAFVMILVATFKTSFGLYIMRQLTSLIDAVFDTTYSVAYGADAQVLRQSAAYRDLLNEVFHVDWLNPILGIGRKRGFKTLVNGLVINSIDNFYVAEFVRYAYPGMFSYILFLIYVGYCMVRDMIKTRSGLIRMCFIGSAMYCLNIKIVDSLQTLKYLYILIAIYMAADKTPYVAPQKKHSKYFKKEKFHFARYE